MHGLKLFFSMYIFIILLDAIWLGLLAKSVYLNSLGPLMRPAPLWMLAFLIYALLALGICWFVLPLAGGSLPKAILLGAMFGLIVYGVYDLTNFTLLANWPLNITIIDMLWGIFLCGVCSTVGFYLRG